MHWGHGSLRHNSEPEELFYQPLNRIVLSVLPNGRIIRIHVIALTLFPDSMTMLGQRWLKVVSSVGPTLDANVGPTSLCSSGERSANMLGQRWPNVVSFLPTTFCQRYANIYGLL